jgi:probable HAF family extracellular repeat protein
LRRQADEATRIAGTIEAELVWLGRQHPQAGERTAWVLTAHPRTVPVSVRIARTIVDGGVPAAYALTRNISCPPALALFDEKILLSCADCGAGVAGSGGGRAGRAPGSDRSGARRHLERRLRGQQRRQVVGVANDRAFLWSTTSGKVDLGTLPGATDSRAAAISERGQIAGTSGDHAFVWSAASGMTDLGTLSAGHGSFATGINDLGEVVGNVSLGDGKYEPFMWTPVVGMYAVGSLPGYVPAVNDRGDLVNYTSVSPFVQRRAGGWFELGTLPGDFVSTAAAINDSAQVVGYSGDGTRTRAFFWSAGDGMVDLGVLPGGRASYATAINNKGQVVGVSESRNGRRLFLWTQAHGMVDLGPLSGTVRDINDSGFIVGSENRRAVVWAPDTTPPSATARLGRDRTIRGLLRNGLRLRLTLSEPATAEVTLIRRGSNRVIARKTVRVEAAGTPTVTLKVNSRAGLRRLSKLRLTLRVAAQDPIGNRRTARNAFTLRH